MKPSSLLLCWAYAAVLLCACSRVDDPSAAIGEPLAGLTSEQLTRFEAGKVLFNHNFTPEEGLGPFFNENQCSACHTSPAAGGTGDQFLIRGTVFSADDGCDLLVDAGGENVRTQAIPALRARGIARQEFPAHATERGSFTATFLFGLGLAELIPERTILAHADPDDHDGDGISGRAGRSASGQLGRFGRKADVATLSEFTETALFHEMGLTTARIPHDPAASALPFRDEIGLRDEPEVSDDVVELITDFVRYLAPPRRRPPADSLERQLISRGDRLFTSIGCTSCHVPSMKTGRSEVAALDRREVHLYSDLLLHDMGPDLANVCGLHATPTELRTAPLLGLRFRQQLLHDGRAHTYNEAILLHGGEAAAARARFLELSETEQIALLTFLDTL